MTTATKSNFIPDGYTESAYVAERVGLYSESRFKFRPMLHGERARIERAVGECRDSKETSRIIYAAIEKQLVEWDQLDRDGSPLKPTLINIARLRPEFITRVFNVVCCYNAPDQDPLLAAPPESGAPDELEQLLDGNGTTAVTKTEADAKN